MALTFTKGHDVAKKQTQIQVKPDRPDSIPLDEAEFLTVQNILLKQRLIDQEAQVLDGDRQELYGRIGARSGVKSISDYTIDMKERAAVLVEDKS